MQKRQIPQITLIWAEIHPRYLRYLRENQLLKSGIKSDNS